MSYLWHSEKRDNEACVDSQGRCWCTRALSYKHPYPLELILNLYADVIDNRKHPKLHTRYLLPLVCDLDSMRVSEDHARSVFLCRDGPLFALVLNESDTAAAWYQSDLAESLETTKYACDGVDIVILRQILHEENLVRG